MKNGAASPLNARDLVGDGKMSTTTEIDAKLRGIESLPFSDLVQRWREIDKIVMGVSEGDQVIEWLRVGKALENIPVGKGHPYFRLGVLHLLRDSSEKKAVDFLEQAYREDERYAPAAGLQPHRMGAYRLLALVKSYFLYLNDKKKQKFTKGNKIGWEAEQFAGNTRRPQISTLLTVYDRSLVHPLDLEGHTYQSFFELVKDRSLCRFAIENYFCSEALITLLLVEGQAAFRNTNEYPISRAIIGLLGGVIEAILSDSIPKQKKSLTLGMLMQEAYKAGIIKQGSRLAALCSLLLYLRNHVHAERDAARTQYFIDLNVARGSKSALDWVVSDLLSLVRQPPP
jgi:hypothetical protein